jgi:D-apiose dehydrogenase
MMTNPLSVGVIGCGFFAQNHLHSWKNLAADGARLAAVCDIDPAKAKAAAETFGAPRWYSGVDRMLAEEKLDLVDIVTRVETHEEMVERTLAARIPTIVQKPFGLDLAAGEAMARAAAAAGVFLAVHENFRFQAPLRRIRELLGAGTIGAPSWARISFRTAYDIYRTQPYLMHEKRFILIDLGVHVLDLARVYLGEVERLSAETQRRDPRVSGEDTATMLLKHRAGGVSVVDCSYDARRLPDTFPETLVEIEGPKGAIVLKPGMKLEVTAGDRMTAEDADASVLDWAARPWHVVQESVFATCAHMLAAVLAGREAETSAADNLKTFALAEAAYESMRTGRAIPMG